MFCEEIQIKKKPFLFIILLHLRILYSSNFILTATSLGTNAVIVKRVNCNPKQTLTQAVKRQWSVPFRCITGSIFWHGYEQITEIHTCTDWTFSPFFYLLMCLSLKLHDMMQTLQTQIRCHILRYLIWVYTVSSGLFGPIFRAMTVLLYKWACHVKTCPLVYVYSKSQDQSVHVHSLVTAVSYRLIGYCRI